MYFVWLMVLFYMFGNIVVDFFCFLLEKLFKLLYFLFIVVGVLFLFLGNGVLDVFVSIVVFIGLSNG